MLDKIRLFFGRARGENSRQGQSELHPGPQADKKAGTAECCGRAFLVFEHTGEVLRAEQVLKDAGFSVEVKGPPPELRTGCDMVIEFPLVEELAVLKELEKARVNPVTVVAVQGELLKPVSLFHLKDYGRWLMVRAANMKITVEKTSGRIVNVSGGGCPDVPYVAAALVGKVLAGADAAPKPREVGHTLCAYALQLAYDEAKSRCYE